MGVLMLNCPTTGRKFSTGINTDEATFIKLPDTPSQAHCPHCGLSHDWRPYQACWMESITPTRCVEAANPAPE
jgi:hypothetical protein